MLGEGIKKECRVICVFGMPRSGTSMTMRLLNLLGVYLGPPDRLMSPNKSNPTGFWEHLKLREINGTILNRLGGSYLEPPSFPPGWAKDPKLADLRHEARAIIREDFGEATLWGWKDNQNCLTLPFWQNLLPDMRYVICLRNPLDVTASREKFARLPFATFSNLWLAYTTGAIEHTAGKLRILVSYEHFLEDWRAELRRLAEFVEAPVSPDAPELQAEVEAFIQEELHHHRSTMKEAVDAPELAFNAKSLYFSLCTIVQGSRSRYLEGVDDREELEEALNIFATYARTEQAALQQKDALLAERDALLAERDAQLAQSSRGITDLEDRLSTTEKELRQAWRAFESVTSTLGYRSVERLRVVVRWLFPPGSWRRWPYRALRRQTGDKDPDTSTRRTGEPEEESRYGPG